MDGYFPHSAEVLENRLGIQDTNELKKAEANISYMRQIEIESEPLPSKYDFQLLLDIHNRLFGDIYYFAGEIRNVDISKGPMPFCYVGFTE